MQDGDLRVAFARLVQALNDPAGDNAASAHDDIDRPVCGLGGIIDLVVGCIGVVDHVTMVGIIHDKGLEIIDKSRGRITRGQMQHVGDDDAAAV